MISKKKRSKWYFIVYFLVNFIIFCIGYILIQESFRRISQGNPGVVFISIGTSLIASGIVMLLEAIRDFLKDGLLLKTKNIIIDGGIEELYQKRDLDKYDEMMANFDKKLYVTGYTLNSFFDSYHEILSKKIKIHPNIDVKMVIVNPESEFSIALRI